MELTVPNLKPRSIDVNLICGLAAQLVQTNPAAKDVLITYEMLVAQRQSYVTPHVWYTAACGMLKVKPNIYIATFCKTIMYPNEGNPTTIMDLSTTYLGVRGALAVIVTLPLLGTAITELNVSRCMLDSTLMVLLAHSITAASLPDLIALDVSQNPCSSLGGEALAELAVRHQGIKTINIDGLEIVGPVARRISALVASRCG